MPILKPPVDLSKYPITHGFWADESANPAYKGFYDLFDGHHPGVDFSLPTGTPIRAALAGTVIRRELHPGMGNVLATRLGNIYVLYAHLQSFCVDLGQVVKSGQLLAYSDNTGIATLSPHLHLELRDLTKSPLKASVFEPIFNHPLPNYLPNFKPEKSL